jgi:hypothetical protein
LILDYEPRLALTEIGRPLTEHERIPIGPRRVLPGFDPSRHLVQVPVARFIELECDLCLRQLEREYGVRVDRSKGSSAIDQTRNIRATEALVEGFDSILFIDSDIMFDALDAVRLLQSDEPVIAGIYAAKKLGNGQLNVDLADGINEIKIGLWADTLYPVKAVGGGFLRIKTSALKHIAKTLELPWCYTGGRWAYPFFQPMVVDMDGQKAYLTEDYAFIRRARDAGLVPKIDTSFRLWHIGDYAFGVEEAAGDYVQRSKNLRHTIHRPGFGPGGTPPSLD